MMDAAVLVVTAVTNPGDRPRLSQRESRRFAVLGLVAPQHQWCRRQRPNLVVVPLAADGTVDLHLFAIPDVVVDVAGYFTSPSCSGGDGRPLPRHPAVPRSRFTRSASGSAVCRAAARAIDPSPFPPTRQAMAHNITIVDNAIPGFVTPYPGPTLPLVSAGNTTAAGQIHAVLSFTQLSPAPATMSYYTLMDTDLVVDTPGYFEGG